MSDKHVVAALQRSVADLELRLREVVRERDEAYEDRRKARQERDLARSAWAGAEKSLVAEQERQAKLRAEVERERGQSAYSKELEANVRRLVRERDEARKYAQACEWALESEQEYTDRLKADLALECREVAERQREACAVVVEQTIYRAVEMHEDVDLAESVRATPLVTEGKP